MADPVPMPRRPAPGVFLTLWTGGDLGAVLTPATRALLAEARPHVCIHAGPDRLIRSAGVLAREIRALLPASRLWLGVGLDWWMGAVLGGSVTRARALAEIGEAADLAVDLGAEAVVWDAEAPFKHKGPEDDALSRELLAATRAKHPALLQGHTAYDGPVRVPLGGGKGWGGHSAYCWKAWLGPDGADFTLPQVYVAPPEEPGKPRKMAPKGALAARRKLSAKSYELATKQGLVRPDLPRGEYYQLHHVDAAQTIAAGAATDLVTLWCAPALPLGRMDAEGERAVRDLCARRCAAA